MGQALPKPALRPFLAEDTPVLAAIFAASVEELTGDDYSEAQQQAWASAVDDEEEFGKRLAPNSRWSRRRGIRRSGLPR
jgi:putative acetyltransferase